MRTIRSYQKPVWLLILLSVIGLLSGCAANPVTGERELTLVSERSELDMGRQQYLPSRQMQGGDYALEPAIVQYVKEVGQKLAAVSDRDLPYEFEVINDSTPNAWALPGGKIAINRGLLLELDNEAELAAVLAHEIVHAAARHGAQGIERGVLLQGALIAAGVATRESDYSQLAVGAAAVGANLINQRYSREAEIEADYYGMTYMARAGYDPMAAVGLQETFVRLAENRRENWLSGLFASHPPSTERVEKNRQRAGELARGGTLGRERYQRKIASLKKDAPAYAAYQEGRKALANNQPVQALALARKAIGIEPREALFHALKGDALSQQRDFREALNAYDQAVQRDDTFFGHLLRRGATRARLDDPDGARRDLQRSVELLPTADAYYILGQLALDAGERQTALAHFKRASASSSEVGRSARAALVRLDLPAHPQQYLKSGLNADNRGNLLISLENPTPLAVRQIQVQLARITAGGQLVVQAEFQSPGVLAAGQRTTLKTDIQLTDGRELQRWRSRVVGARVVQ